MDGERLDCAELIETIMATIEEVHPELPWSWSLAGRGLEQVEEAEIALFIARSSNASDSWLGMNTASPTQTYPCSLP